MVVTGAALEELFVHAADGLAVQLFSAPERLSGYKVVRRTIELNAQTCEELLVDWLNELIYVFFADGFLCAKACVSIREEAVLSGCVEGYSIPPKDMVYAREIKAATYHGLKIEKNDAGLEAEVLLDV